MTPDDRTLYDVAREVTDEALGDGTYATLNSGNPDPGVQAAIKRFRREKRAQRDRVRRG